MIAIEDITLTTQLPPFLPYPRFLLELPLSRTAQLVYCLILSRIQLSQSNGWVDDSGRVYCRYPILSLAEDAHLGKTAVAAALKDLETQGLLIRNRGGPGYANRLSLRIPEPCTSGIREGKPLTSGNANPILPEIRTSDFRKGEPLISGKPNTNKTTNKTKSKTTDTAFCFISKKPNYDYLGDSL